MSRFSTLFLKYFQSSQWLWTINPGRIGHLRLLPAQNSVIDNKNVTVLTSLVETSAAVFLSAGFFFVT